MKGRKIIITGATGMVGSNVLHECIQSSEIGHIISFVRKSTGLSHSKLQEVVLPDFLDYSAQVNLFKEVDIVYFCIGVYTGAVSKERFKEITVDYTIAFADMLKAHSPQARFCFLSGAGADRSEKSSMIFAKTKGMAENYLLSHLKNAHSLRPAYIYPVEPRKEPNFSYRLFRGLYPLFKCLGKNASIPSTDLAKAMFYVGLKGADLDIFENKDMLDFLERI